MKRINADHSSMLANFQRVCKARGLRITHQRTEIFISLLKHTDHPTTDELYNQVRRHLRTISLDTVYRTIATFEEYGLIRRVHHLDNSTRFDVNVSDHHHLVCTKCNRIEDFNWPDFDRMHPPDSISDWGQIQVKQVVINGLCSRCKK